MHKKLNIFLFIIGIIISIFGGVLDFQSPFSEASVLLVILLGILIGLLNVDITEEAGFLLSALVFIFSTFFLLPYLNNYMLLSNLAAILENLAVLTASATVIVSLRWVINFTSSLDHHAHEDHVKRLPKFEKYWGFIMLFAVAIVIVQLVIEQFFSLPLYDQYKNIIDILILIIFVIDLIIIYIDIKSFKGFIKTAWLDIIATIPFTFLPIGNLAIFRSLKAVRLMKLFKAQKITKIVRVNKALKFFSDKSKFNHYVHKKT